MGNCCTKETINVKVRENIVNHYNNLTDFECCICFEENKTKLCMLECKHNICDKCYIQLLAYKKEFCPICSRKMKSINIDKSKYIMKAYSKEFDSCDNYDNMCKILSYLNYTNLTEDNYNKIINCFGKVAIIKIIDNNILFIFIPNYLNNFIIRFNINSFNKNSFKVYYNKLYNDELYSIWYDSKETFDDLVEKFIN